MKLRNKTLLIAGIALVGLTVVLYVFAVTILLNGFVIIEEQNTRENVERTLTAVSDELTNLSSINRDYASWDDTYTFIEDENDNYPQVNLVDATFTNLRLNLMIFIHSSGRVVFGKAFDLQNEQEIAVPDSLQAHLSAGALLLQHSNSESDLTGIILLPEGPMLISSRPILTSEYQGPIRGTLVFGRYLDSAEIEQLAQTTHLSLMVRQFDDPEMPSDLQAMRAALSEEAPTVIRPLSAQSIAGYSLIWDIYKKPALLLRVDLARTIYQQGEATIRYFVVSLVVASLILGVVTLWLVDQVIMSRLARLSAGVNRVGASGDLSARVQMGGKDELSSLAGAFNNLVARLQQTVEDLETRVAGRTAELAEATGKLRRRADQLETSAEIAHAATSLLDPDLVVTQVVEMIRERFDFYYVGLYLTDDVGRHAVLRQGTGEAGRVMKERGHRLEIGTTSLVGGACAHKQARIALDVGQDAVRFANPLLPDTRSEMALPLRVGERVVGALDVQSIQKAAFDENDIAVLQGMADQIATGLENARLFQETQRALKERDLSNKLLARQGWIDYLETAQGGVRTAEFLQVGASSPASQDASNTLNIPLEISDLPVGTLVMERQSNTPWQEEEVQAIRTIAQQAMLSADNARLVEQTQYALQETEGLFAAARDIAQAAQIQDICQSLAGYVNILEQADRTIVTLVDTGRRQILARVGAGNMEGELDMTYDEFDAGLGGQVLRSGEPVLSLSADDSKESQETRERRKRHDIGSLIIVPLSVKGQVLGTVSIVNRTHQRKFNQRNVDLALALAGPAATALENVRLLEATQRRAEREQRIRHITTRVRAAGDIQGILETTAAELAQAIGASRAIVRLTASDGR